ncbi:hypothetical protein [Chitinimonas taiwanensis]|uniref:hypothetical protein n=1 Tax=Chitinimonas taiwanensis TaxID=240412 RepID=UPI0035AEAC46
MKSHQIQDLIVRISAAAGVAIAMLITIHTLTTVSQQHIERDLASYASHTQLQVAGSDAAKRA